jgi:hypothetical protein
MPVINARRMVISLYPDRFWGKTGGSRRFLAKPLI